MVGGGITADEIAVFATLQQCCRQDRKKVVQRSLDVEIENVVGRTKRMLSMRTSVTR